MIRLTAWIESFMFDEIYLINNYNLQSANTKIWIRNTPFQLFHTHSILSNKNPLTDRDLFIGESYVSWTLRVTASPDVFWSLDSLG